ncbi:carboxyl transferase domain-containing protein [Rhodococcus sp. P1Y]|uniref:carboxyl transferase domain-containing protein n=1 Tax=Rhodococcus sp. P1Y TaxID=1302308 RepID=UPI000EB4A7FB|nr:carboxyl transferase domain-containing protein [Rhodococcus sp. P1Y]AYJ50334.1 acetyl-CoA carboxylase carboxyl transferase subunit beta [Rhodococcus sp. P1Y]
MSTATPPDAFVEEAPAQLVSEWDADLRGGNPLDFPGYEAERAGSSGEAVRTGAGFVGGTACAIIESDFTVFGGSMGMVVGERVARAFRRAAAERLPVVASVRTGGARMQEGMLSLIQMPRVVAAIEEHAACGRISLGYLRSPTTGGVFASWVSLLDLRVAESDAVVGFAGPRVVAEMTGSWPPATSHTSESACAAGLVDAVVPSGAAQNWVAAALGGAQMPLELPLGRPPLGNYVHAVGRPDTPSMADIRAKARPSGLEWAAMLCESWTEIKGSDPSMRAGLATVGGVRCVVVAMDRHAHGDGCARQTPAGFALAQRAIDLASRLQLPVLTLVDTPGAEPSEESEAGGIAREIARTLRSLNRLSTASVSVCVGEGGSGGAIALAHTDTFLMLEHSVFSVIGPEAAAVILWRDRARALEATRALRIDAHSLLELGVCDGVLPSVSVGVARKAVAAALTESVPANRHRRVDAATAKWLEG